MIEYELPLPPSVNNLFSSNVRGARFVGAKYKEWRRQANAYLMAQGKLRTIEGPVCVTITIRDEGPGDLDNRCKAILDFLVHHKIIEDDNRNIVREIHLQWGDVDGAVVRLVRPADWIYRDTKERAA